MSPTETVPEFITTFLRARCPDIDSVGVDDDLVESGVLNSMHFVELLYLIEAELGTEISLDEVTTDDFRTISRITQRFFAQGRSGSGGTA
ncbi:acyl carrier protein [Micromonospora sp. CPCC 205561]|uniref:acyl carrier protein n=1 Tax=Micromonospora sp. CPCC 205561 TaxID=3122407 RepID=UPI002FF378CB